MDETFMEQITTKSEDLSALPDTVSLLKLARTLRAIDSVQSAVAANASSTEGQAAALNVSVRVRPPFVNKHKVLAQKVASGKVVGHVSAVQTEGTRTLHILGERTGHRKFEFPHIFGPKVSQAEVYNTLGLGAVPRGALEGYNACILSYGQTGSGKTHSMLGEWNGDTSDVKAWQLLLPPFPYDVTKLILAYTDFRATNISRQGIIPRLCGELFYYVDLLPPAERATVHISGNFFEIYNEQERTLSSDAIHSYDDVHRMLMEGSKIRTTRATKMNDVSSRSHGIFSLHIRRSSGGAVINSRIDLVDLAGSERVGQNAEEELELKEGCHINLSLLTLGRVVSSLAERSQREQRDEARRKRDMEKRPDETPTTTTPRVAGVSGPPVRPTPPPRPPTSARVVRPKSAPAAVTQCYVPFRESRLTSYLESTLGGNARSYLIAHASPEAPHLQETLSTLRYATECSRIQNRACTNRQSISQHAAQTIDMLCDLRMQVFDARDKVVFREEEMVKLKKRLPDAANAAVVNTLREKIKDKETQIEQLRLHIRATRELYQAAIGRLAACLREDCPREVTDILRQSVELAARQAP